MEEREEKFAPITLPLRVKFDKWTETFIINNANGEYVGRAVERGLARKFAAAPEMYECICDALTDLEMSNGMRAYFEEVLKKARGEA